MANVVLPQVSILNNLANNANLLVEQNGEINRFAVTDLDIGGGDVTIDLASGINSAANPIDADTLNGHEFDYFASKNDLNDYATAEQVEEIIANLPKDDLDIKLNYSVVGGTTQPTNPTKNMIWVNTDEKITGWIFNHNRPIHPSQGLVWIATRESSMVSLNTLKINDIETDLIYILSAEQYINGAWQAKYTKIYYDSQWNECWNGGLYDNGYEWETITGGWKIIPVQNYVISPTVKKESTFLNGSIPSGGRSAAFITDKKIDITEYNTLNLSTLSIQTNYNFSLVLDYPTAEFPTSSSYLVATLPLSENLNKAVQFIDISTLQGSYYIAIWNYGTNAYDIKVDKIWLE